MNSTVFTKPAVPSATSGNKRKFCATQELRGAERESNSDGKDHFFQPHLKSQVTQKLVNQQSDDAMKQVCELTLDKLRCGASTYYKGLQSCSKQPEQNNNESSSAKTQQLTIEGKPVKRELLRPSILFDVNSNETQSGDFKCCNIDPNATTCYYCSVLICTAAMVRTTEIPCGIQCALCRQYFCIKCRCENLCLGCS